MHSSIKLYYTYTHLYLLSQLEIFHADPLCHWVKTILKRVFHHLICIFLSVFDIDSADFDVQAVITVSTATWLIVIARCIICFWLLKKAKQYDLGINEIWWWLWNNLYTLFIFSLFFWDKSCRLFLIQLSSSILFIIV